ncbi:molybdopterin-synthase adenylyltransferase MoeB [Leptobacterium flavescens]|uniref:Molybdopterin-synthase adenylyltransferase n=1 Tax=Leptobacterium flavescens TaxID=472055 RepID=A0A6P0UIX5_9FLAO|nr:molybdopterin-synthase adenylyltransferase MoeB [Leptobacterium flavescens]NER11868.1 molybdopterin-synthase adenylyltransferase MoeB [Leptobacterium flavescens]
MSNLNRYSRHILLPEIGHEGQQKISSASVLVIGAGGLGCPVLQYLAAAGVGRIGIIDFDVVEESNLQRQILYGTSALGKNKALAAKERLEDLNPLITINAYPEKLTVNNALQLFSEYDIVVDGTDNFSTRYLVNDACVITAKPLVYGSIFKFEGQVSVFNYNNGPSYRCLFPKPPKAGSVPSCSEIGVLGVLPGIIGSMQANEALKIILGNGDSLSGSLLLYNSLTAESNILKVKRVEAEIAKTVEMQESFTTIDYDLFCGIETAEEIEEISTHMALEKEEAVFLDVRETHEQPKIDDVSPVYITLGELENRMDSLDKEKEWIVFCQSGMRSKKAVELMNKNGFKNTASLKGGAIALTGELSRLAIKDQYKNG